MKFEVYEHKTQYYETDQMGIIHHANYLHWFEEARIDIMEQMGMGYDMMENRELSARFCQSAVNTRVCHVLVRQSRF